jgi:hypothetical protein
MTARDDGFFSFLTPAEIYHQLTEGPGSTSMVWEQQKTAQERSEENERAAMIRSLANTITSGWQGTASAGAYGAAMPLAERAFENAAKLDNAQDLLSRQIDSFHTAKNSVVPVGDPPEMSIDEKFPFDVDHEKAVKEYQDSVQNNIAAFRAYDGASHYNETNLPQEYSNDIRAGGDVSVKGPTDTIEVGGPGPGSGGPRSGGPGDSAGPPGSSGYFGDSSFPGGPSSGGPGASEPGGSQTSPSEFRPVAPPSRQGLPFSYPPAGAPSPVSGGFVGGGEYPGGGFGPLGGGSSGGGVSGRGPAGGGGPVGGPGGTRGPAFGPGAGVGALAAEEAAARRAAQAPAVAGRPGGVGPVGAPVGTGRGKDDEDAEHQRKILIEADAEETFGSDELTAPQVIGDDEYED